jgi:hypothetical protein
VAASRWLVRLGSRPYAMAWPLFESGGMPVRADDVDIHHHLSVDLARGLGLGLPVASSRLNVPSPVSGDSLVPAGQPGP